jgi:hypothetical protein
MTGADKIACWLATLLLLFTLSTVPARAQFGGGADAGGSGGDMMTQMAPVLNMVKAKMGKRRFGALMQTVGPIASRMMQNGGGGLGGMLGGGGGSSYAEGFGMSSGGGFSNVLGAGGGELMSMAPQLMQLASLAGGSRHRRHRRH